MTFLPIATRELRVAARRRSTFWLRVVAALVALVIGGGFMLMSAVGGMGTASLGGQLFSVVTWMAAACAFAAGLFFTADCLSEEKREGTLGLLFLTDLRGYDVVLGKLLATSLRGFFAVFAVFPILAVTLVMGGVTGAQFWKCVLALTNALLWSLVLGLFVSTFSRDSQKSLAGMVVLLVLFLAGTALADSALRRVWSRYPQPILLLFNPGYVFAMAGYWGRTSFWSGFLLNQLVTGALLVTACMVLPRVWQERPNRTLNVASGGSYSLKYGSRSRRLKLRHNLLPVNPALWLACRERWQAFGVWAIAFFVAAAFAVMAALHVPVYGWSAWSSINGFIWLLLLLWAASQSSRFFFESRQNGLFELLLGTPLTVREIVQGQWRALLRLFGAPMLLLLLVHFGGQVFVQQATWGTVSAQLGVPGSRALLAMCTSFLSVVSTTGDLVALVWFGMWMGLISKRASFATLKTLLFVEIIPWMGIGFVSGILLSLIMFPMAMKAGATKTGPGAAMSFVTSLWPMVFVGLQAVLSLTKDLVFILWSRKKLYTSFREQVSREATLAPATVSGLPPVIHSYQPETRPQPATVGGNSASLPPVGSLNSSPDDVSANRIP